MNYLGCSFMMLTYEKGMRFSSSVYHFGFITIFILYVFFKFSGIVKKAQKLEARRKLEKEKKQEGGSVT